MSKALKIPKTLGTCADKLYAMRAERLALQKQVRDAPSSLATQMLLSGLRQNRQFRRQKTAAKQLCLEKVLDAVLATDLPLILSIRTSA